MIVWKCFHTSDFRSTSASFLPLTLFGIGGVFTIQPSHRPHGGRTWQGHIQVCLLWSSISSESTFTARLRIQFSKNISDNRIIAVTNILSHKPLTCKGFCAMIQGTGIHLFCHSCNFNSVGEVQCLNLQAKIEVQTGLCSC